MLDGRKAKTGIDIGMSGMWMGEDATDIGMRGEIDMTMIANRMSRVDMLIGGIGGDQGRRAGMRRLRRLRVGRR